MLQRSIMRPRTGTAIALRIPPNDKAKEAVARCQPVSAMIGLRNTPNVKPRMGPLQTNKPVTAPTTTHHGLVNFSPMTLPSRTPGWTAGRPGSLKAISRAGQCCRPSVGALPQDRTLLPDPLLVGFGLPAGELVAPAPLLPGCGGTADRLGSGFHRRGFRRAFKQALALRRAVRAQIGVAGFVADRDDHMGAAGGLCRGFAPAAFETAIKAEPRPCFRELIAATAIRHSSTLDPASVREAIDRISVVRPAQSRPQATGPVVASRRKLGLAQTRCLARRRMRRRSRE